jgi:hypothetical protein
MFDKLACSLFFAADSLGASPDASLASVFAFCIGSFCCANEPACSGDRFSGPSAGCAAFGTAAITGPDVGHACASGVALRFALITAGEEVATDCLGMGAVA